jgi:DME family drug/metabolite transporter
MLLVLSAALLWATIGPVSKFAFQAGVSALETAFWRGVIASVFFGVHATVRGKLRISRNDFLPLAAFGLFGVSLLEGSYLLAVEKGGAALSSILLYSAPIWVAIFSRVLFGEKLGSAKLLALAIALAGVAGVALAGANGAAFTKGALFWGLVSGLSYASFYIFGKYFLERHEPVTLLAWSFPIGALGLLPFVHFAPKSAQAWDSLLLLGFASTYAAYFLYYRGLREIEPTRAAVVASIEPVAATFLAYWIWSERLAPLGYFWASWVIGGILLMVRAN